MLPIARLVDAELPPGEPNMEVGCPSWCLNARIRNAAWLAADLPPNPRAAAKIDDFELPKLLHMDVAYFKSSIWPHMFYISEMEIWRWKMNVARVKVNTRDEVYLSDLARAFGENQDDRVRAMCAWALGRVDRPKAGKALSSFLAGAEGQVALEIRWPWKAPSEPAGMQRMGNRPLYRRL